MPSRRFKSPLHRLLYKLGHSPVDLAEGIPHLLIIWVLLLTLTGFGGFLEFGHPMVGVSNAILVLAGVHAVVVFFRKESLGYGWEFLLPVPFLFLALIHFLFLSPVPWAAALGLCGFVQAYILYFVAFNSIKGRESAQWVLFSCEFVIIVAVLAGFRQYYMHPGGMMLPGRIRFPEYAHGMAGYLQDPQTLASLILLIWPSTVIIAWMRRFLVPVRILNAFCAVTFPIGLLLSANRLGLFVFFLQFLALPLFLTGEGWLRRRLWGYGIAVLALSLGVFWYVTDGLHQRIQFLLTAAPDALTETSLQTGWRLFLDAPLFGQGFASYGFLWDHFNPDWSLDTSVYSASSILDLLAEFGAIGLILALVPFFIVLCRALLSWRTLPHITYDQDIIRRLKYLSPRQRSKNKLARAESRTSSSKILLGGLLLGMIGLLVSQLADYSLKLPLHLFLVGCLFASFAIIGAGYTRKPVSRLAGRIFACVPFLLAIGCWVFGVSRFEAQYLYYTANEKLQVLLNEPDRIFANPRALDPVEADFSKAVDMVPGHAGAWIGLAESRLAHFYAEEESPAEIAKRAGEPLQEALNLLPSSWKIHYSLARVAVILEKPLDEVKRHLQRARDLAPRRPEPDAFLGVLLLMEDRQSKEGKELIGLALEKYPEYGLVRQLQPWLELSAARSDTAEIPTLDGSLVTPAFVGRQFEILPVVHERVRGAGLPRF